ncbi:hypothetical protein HMPREF1028_02023 [Neisseria sp. GT4A_CT1]|nr:hypothetical protein HMPREF1028_02023 [Neisseria sp. GT4A_CT1]
MNDTSFVCTILHLTCFCIFNCFSHIRSNSTHFRVWHQATWTQDGTQLTNDAHCIRRSNNNVKVQITCFDLSSQIFKADNISTSFFSCISICTLSKYCYAGCFTGTFRQNN